MDFVEVPLRGREALARDLFERRVIGDLDLRPAFSPPVDYVEIIIGKPQRCNSVPVTLVSRAVIQRLALRRFLDFF